MTKEEIKQLDEILNGKPFEVRPRLIAWRKTIQVTEEPKSPRTGQQNNALHLFCKMLADALNDAGKDMRIVLKPEYNIPWDTESVKTHIWKPIMKARFGKDSTTQLKKTGEIDEVHKIIMREIREKHGIEYIPFPVDTGRQFEELSGEKIGAVNNLSNDTYPKYNGGVIF